MSVEVIMSGNTNSNRVPERTFVSYIDKSRNYYAAHGYEHPYRWSQYDDVPFAALKEPMANSRVAFVTTSSLVRGPGAASSRKSAYADSAHPVPDAMYTADLSWDKDATNTDDMGSFLPLSHLADVVSAGRVGSASSRFYGVPTGYSQRRTRDVDAPDIVRWCIEDGVDAVILVPL